MSRKKGVGSKLGGLAQLKWWWGKGLSLLEHSTFSIYFFFSGVPKKETQELLISCIRLHILWITKSSTLWTDAMFRLPSQAPAQRKKKAKTISFILGIYLHCSVWLIPQKNLIYRTTHLNLLDFCYI